MKRKPYLPYTDAGKTLWLSNFAEKLPGYAATLGITPAQLAQIQTDADAFGAILVFQNTLKNTMEGFTSFKNLLRKSQEPLSPMPSIPAPPVLPSGVQANIFGRIADLVQTIKNHPNYNEVIGDDLRIIGEEHTTDPNEWKPILKMEYIAGSPNIKWTKGDSDGIKIKVNRGTGYEFLAIDTKPDYLDKHPLPPSGQSAIWKYIAIYILNDEEVGQWSDEVEVAVKGVG